jgi:hypothetical protein
VIVLKLNEDGILYNVMFYNTNFFMIKQKKYLLFIFFNEIYNEYFKNDFKLLLFESQIS